MHSPNAESVRKVAELPYLAYRFRQVSRIIAFFVASLGFVVFCGWAFHVPALTYIRPTFPSMKVNTALSFLCLGTGLWLARNDERRRGRRILGLFVAVIAAATLAEYAFHVSLGIDQLLLRDTGPPALSGYPGRMAVASAICFLLMGLAVASLGLKKVVALQRASVAACLGLSLIALCGYLYGARSLYLIAPLSTMAVHTAAGFLAAGLAYFLARPDEGIVSIAAGKTSSGLLLRNLLPAIIIVPILIGWLRLAGERANLYDTQFGVSLQVLGSIGCLTLLMVLIIRSMDRSERERAQVEEALRESELRFRLLADSVPALIWMSDTDKLCTYFNKPWLDFTGRSLESQLGNGWAQGIHPEDLQPCIDICTQAVDRREEFRMEYRLRRHDGEYRWILGFGVPRFDQDRAFAGCIGIGIDVTERKLADEVRFRHAAMVESFDDAIKGVDTNGIITNWNKGAERLFGYSAQEAIGRNILLLSTPEDPDDVSNVLKRVLAGEVVRNYETVRLRKDGTRVEVSLTISPIVDAEGRVIGTSGIARDITERKRAEEALRESEEKFRSVFRDAAVGMVIVSPEGRFLAANGTFCGCLGYTEEELLEKTVQSVTFPEDWPAFSQRLSEALAGGQRLRRVEKRCLHRSGRIVYTESSTAVIRNREGGPQYLVGEVLDVTQRKEAEEALSGMMRKLVEAQEQERARIARELHDDITQRLVLLALEIEQAQEHPQETSSEARGQAHQLSMKAKEISTDIQVLSHQLHSSKLEYLGLVGGIRSWCNEFGERQEMEIAFRSAGLQDSPPPEISLCLFRVLQEALNNAARHSGAKQVDVQLREESGEIQLIVRDSGKGFDLAAAMQDRGLGVVSMQERVRLVGGTIVIDSKPLAGTTIHVRVPSSAKPRRQMAAG